MHTRRSVITQQRLSSIRIHRLTHHRHLIAFHTPIQPTQPNHSTTQQPHSHLSTAFTTGVQQPARHYWGGHAAGLADRLVHSQHRARLAGRRGGGEWRR